MYRKNCSTPRCSTPRTVPKQHRINCLRSMKTLDFSISSSLAEDGNPHALILTRRTVKRSLEKYFGFTLAHLTSLLVEFIHQQASVGVRSKDLTPFKDLLCVANEGNVGREVLFILIRKIKRGKLARKWNLVLSTDLINDAARYGAALKQGIPAELIPTPYFEANLPHPDTTDASTTSYESLDLDQPSIVTERMGRSSRIPAVVVNDEYGRAIDDPSISLSYRRTPRHHRLGSSYNPAIFENVVASSTPEFDLNKKIDASWRKRMGLPSKPPRGSFYNDASSYLQLSRVPFLSRDERRKIRLDTATPKSLHRERMRELMEEIHKINTYRPQYRYKFL